MNDKQLLELMSDLRAMHLWSQEHVKRMNKDYGILVSGGSLTEHAEQFWKRAAMVLGMAQKMKALFMELANDADNNYLLLSFMSSAAEALGSMRHPTAGSWVDEDTIQCPVCEANIYPEYLELLSLQNWYSHLHDEGGSPQVTMRPLPEESRKIVFLHDHGDESVAKCMINVESLTVGAADGIDSKSLR